MNALLPAFEKFLRLVRDDLKIFVAGDNSMHTCFRQGDLFVVDPSKCEPAQGVFAFDEGEGPIVRHVANGGADGSLILFSDDPAIPNKPMPRANFRLTVIGRVVSAIIALHHHD